MRNTATAAPVSHRLEKVVSGTPHAIGNGFAANHFSEEMFDSRMDPLLMVDHFVMTAPTFDVRANSAAFRSKHLIAI